MFLNWWVATQKRVTKPFCVGRGVCSQWNDINNKTRNSKCFFFILMRDFYFRTRAWKLLTGMSDALKSRDCREFLRGSNVNREMLKINKCQNFGYITIKKKIFFFFFQEVFMVIMPAFIWSNFKLHFMQFWFIVNIGNLWYFFQDSLINTNIL